MGSRPGIHSAEPVYLRGGKLHFHSGTAVSMFLREHLTETVSKRNGLSAVVRDE